MKFSRTRKTNNFKKIIFLLSHNIIIYLFLLTNFALYFFPFLSPMTKSLNLKPEQIKFLPTSLIFPNCRIISNCHDSGLQLIPVSHILTSIEATAWTLHLHLDTITKHFDHHDEKYTNIMVQPKPYQPALFLLLIITTRTRFQSYKNQSFKILANIIISDQPIPFRSHNHCFVSSCPHTSLLFYIVCILQKDESNSSRLS